MTNKMPAWDLSDYYQDLHDTKIAEDLQKYQRGGD